jgi:hypothetical protein
VPVHRSESCNEIMRDLSMFCLLTVNPTNWRWKPTLGAINASSEFVSDLPRHGASSPCFFFIVNAAAGSFLERRTQQMYGRQGAKVGPHQLQTAARILGLTPSASVLCRAVRTQVGVAYPVEMKKNDFGNSLLDQNVQV